jgi:L-threonylcarbamoyladenylate synthase
MIVLMNGERMMYNVFKDIPEVAWQIMDLSENPTTIILDNPRNVAANLVAPDNTLGTESKEPFSFKLLEKMKTISFHFSKYFRATYSKSFKEISPEIMVWTMCCICINCRKAVYDYKIDE